MNIILADQKSVRELLDVGFPGVNFLDITDVGFLEKLNKAVESRERFALVAPARAVTIFNCNGDETSLVAHAAVNGFEGLATLFRDR